MRDAEKLNFREKQGMSTIKKHRIVHKSRSFAEADEWDIQQHIQMTPAERQRVAKELRKRVYGTNVPDVREAHGRK